MNQDKINACKMAITNAPVDVRKCFIFTETRDGEIRFFTASDNLDCEYLYKESNKKHRKHRNENKVHIFHSSGFELEWIETYNDDTDMFDVPVDIDDDAFLELAKEAHEKDITFNQHIVNILQDCIKKENNEQNKKK